MERRIKGGKGKKGERREKEGWELSPPLVVIQPC